MNSIWISGFDKNRGVGCVQTENKLSKKNCKIELLELLDYWMRVLQVTERSSGSFPHVGEDDL